MMMRITRREQGDLTVLHVEGGLTGLFVDEMTRACSALDGRFALDLANLRCVDAAGVQLLVELASRGVELLGASPYIALRLQQQCALLPASSLPPCSSSVSIACD